MTGSCVGQGVWPAAGLSDLRTRSRRPGALAKTAPLIALLFACFAPAAQTPAPSRAPVLVELFTSEGCSDCPPADRLLAQLDPQVIVLSEHVDYWDHQGWKDPFSSHEFTMRQQEYVERFHIDGPYTPQMIVDGMAQFVGSDAQSAKQQIANAGQRPKAQIRLAPAGDDVKISVSGAPNSAAVFVAVAQDSAASDVGAGENKGRRLTYVSVLRSLRKIGSVKRGGKFEQTVPLKAQAKDRIIVFLQQGTSGPVGGAAELER